MRPSPVAGSRVVPNGYRIVLHVLKMEQIPSPEPQGNSIPVLFFVVPFFSLISTRT